MIDSIRILLNHGYHSSKIIEYFDWSTNGWASPTATDVEWDAIALSYDSGCNHKWVVWPFDFKLLQCKHCGAEKHNDHN